MAAWSIQSAVEVEVETPLCEAVVKVEEVVELLKLSDHPNLVCLFNHAYPKWDPVISRNT